MKKDFSKGCFHLSAILIHSFQIEKWCQVGVELLASQPVEAFNAEEGAKMCLQEIETFMKNKSGISMKKIRQLNELCQKLQNKDIDERVALALKKIEEVTELLEKRETRYTKIQVLLYMQY